MTLLIPTDLTMFADIAPDKAQAMIEDAEAMAVLSAPCLAEPESLTQGQQMAFKALLRGAILRWNEAGTGALTQKSQTTGPWSTSESYDTRQQRRGMFWPSELVQLQKICAGESTVTAFSIDTISLSSLVHGDVCALNFGALYCSCGATLTQSFPLYEV